MDFSNILDYNKLEINRTHFAEIIGDAVIRPGGPEWLRNLINAIEDEGQAQTKTILVESLPNNRRVADYLNRPNPE